MKKLRIYLDTCCYNRPFDDLRQHRVRIEAETIASILAMCKSSQCELVGSTMLDLEFQKIRDVDRLENILLVYKGCADKVRFDKAIRDRAMEFTQFGVKTADAYHMAMAERGKASLLTTDDRLIKASARTSCCISVMNPIAWIMEVYNNG